MKFKYIQGGGFNTQTNFNCLYFIFILFVYNDYLLALPVEGCSGRELTWIVMRMHFWYRQVRDTVVILEEVNPPHPLCALCKMLLLWKALNGTHRHTAYYNRSSERKSWRLAAEEEM